MPCKLRPPAALITCTHVLVGKPANEPAVESAAGQLGAAHPLKAQRILLSVGHQRAPHHPALLCAVATPQKGHWRAADADPPASVVRVCASSCRACRAQSAGNSLSCVRERQTTCLGSKPYVQLCAGRSIKES